MRVTNSREKNLMQIYNLFRFLTSLETKYIVIKKINH